MLALYLSMLEDDGDKAIFTEIYEPYERKIYAVAMHLTSSAPKAEDAVHDTMIKVIKHFDDAKKLFRKSCDEFDPWIVTITKNTALDILRKEGRTTEMAEDWDMPVPDNVHPESEFRALVGEIRGMPEKYRRVLELRLVLEWSFDEIGRELDITENTARTRFQRGRIMLRERLEAMGYNDKGRVL